MSHRLAGCSGFDPRLLEGEVPFGGAICIINEHEGGVVFQALRLLDHGELVLLHESLTEKTSNRSYKWDVVEDIPGGVDIDTACI
jgi:hypothetical protein